MGNLADNGIPGDRSGISPLFAETACEAASPLGSNGGPQVQTWPESAATSARIRPFGRRGLTCSRVDSE